MVTGGDIVEVKYSNPNVGSGFFFPIAGEDSTFDLGGFRNDDSGVVDGKGALIVSKNRKPWSFEVTVSNDMLGAQELEKAKALHADTNDTVWSFALSNGAVYTGKGAIVCDLELNGNKATFTLKVKGGGDLKQ
jgi:hypothetical protein